MQRRLRDHWLQRERPELAQTSLASDNVLGDGATLQIPTVTGNVTDGYVINLTVGVAV